MSCLTHSGRLTNRLAGALIYGLLILFTLGLVACSPFVGIGQSTVGDAKGSRLQAGRTLGQTFLARHAGLEGIEVYLRPGRAGNGAIRLHLRPEPGSSSDLARSSLYVEAVTEPRFYRFTFDPQSDSRGRTYYAFVELEGEGSVWLGSAPGDTYLQGALYDDGEPGDAQMVFQLVYQPQQALLGLAGEAIQWVGILAAGLFLFVLPGWALLVTLWPAGGRLPWPARLGLAIGLSLALYPVLFLWTDLIGLHLGPLYAWLPASVGLAVILWQARRWRPARAGDRIRAWLRSEAFWPDLALLAVAGLIFLVRFYAVRSLDVPMWGDSYQHTMIAQLLVDNGGLFDSWEPYAKLQTLTYHFGFHSDVAVFHWITGLPLPRATLWVGQILNGLAALALYPLALRLGGSRWAGVGAVLVAGLLSPMPMFYVNWGRYTQLAGQVILPVAVFLAWKALAGKNRDWRLIGLSWIALGGLALTHYRVLIFAVLFFPALLLLKVRKGRLRALATRTPLLAAGAGFLFLPWFVHIFSGRILNILASQLNTPALAPSAWTQGYNAIGDLFFYLPPLVWLALAVGIGWGIWRRQKGVAILGLWWLLILLAANPQWLRLPGAGALSNFAVFIAAYIPAALLIGAAVGWLSQRFPARGTPIMLALLAIGLALWGARHRMADLNEQQHVLVTRPDVKAAAWIRDNTRESARFLVNSFFAYGGSVIVGSDGGWWLPQLAGRQTNVPPLNYGSEQGPRPDFREWVNELTTEIQAKGIDHPEMLNILRQRGFTHVYIGQRQGRVNYDGPHVMDPEQLLASSYFRPVYHQNRVWVFEIRESD